MNISGMLSSISLRNIVPYHVRLSFLYKCNAYVRCDAQSNCSTVARNILQELRSNITAYRANFINKSMTRVNCRIVDIMDEQCDPSFKYISDHNCNVLAILCLDECFFKLSNDYIDDPESICSMIEVLNTFVNIFTSPPYQSKTFSDHIDEHLHLYKFKFMGQGIQYLLESAKQRKKGQSDISNNITRYKPFNFSPQP